MIKLLSPRIFQHYIAKSFKRRLWILRYIFRDFRLRLYLCSGKDNSKLIAWLFFSEKVVSIGWLDQRKEFKQIKGSSFGEVCSPNFKNKNQFSKVIIPPIRYFVFKQAKVHTGSSHILNHNQLCMERLPDVPLKQCNYATGLVKAYSNDLAILRASEEIEIPYSEAIFLGGNGSWNYYHLTFEIFAKVYYFKKLDLSHRALPLLVSEEVSRNSNFSDLLHLLIDGTNWKPIFFDRQKLLLVEKLHHINSPSNIVFNASRKNIFRTHNQFFDMESINFIREKVLNVSMCLSDYDLFKKNIFLARRDGSLRSYNQGEVESVLEKYSFHTIYIEDYNIFQQAALFRNADIVIGPTGAAWTNLIYASPGLKALSWLPDNMREFSAFSTLAYMFGCKLKFIPCEANSNNIFHSDYHLDIGALTSAIDDLVHDQETD